MFRFSLTQLLMGTALVAILSVFMQTGGCGRPYRMIECLSFSSDGSRILVTKLNARSANVPGKGYKADVSRTISWVNAKTGAFEKIVRQDHIPGNSGPAFGLWRVGRTSAVFNPLNDVVSTTNFGAKGLTHYVESGAGVPSHGKNLQYSVGNLALSTSGRFLAASGESSFNVFDNTSNSIPLQISYVDWLGFDPVPMTFNADETQLVVAGFPGVRVFELANGQEIGRILPDVHVDSLHMLPDNSLIVCADASTKSYDLSGNLIDVLSTSSFDFCAVSSDGNVFASEHQGEVVLFDLSAISKVKKIEVGASVFAVAFSPDGQTLAAGDYDGKLSLIDIKTGEILWRVSPPGRERWPWTYPFGFLMLWCLGAVILARRSSKAKQPAANSTIE